ncbi:MAG: heavy metal translocating P-type ATPase [Alphaproteobacteria bacterium]|nr:MAG: heavy metal translocating P-type ATPase [Alphaproteobacteria bacterium]
MLPDGRRETVPAAELAPGDRIEVLPGAGMPTDGRILTGRTEIDRSMLTGETIPVDAGAGDAVHAGEINLSAPIEVEVTARAAESTLARIAEMVATAENARNRYTSLADRAARIYAPGVHGLAALAFLGWMAAGAGVVDALRIAIATLIITCPCALGLAVPAVSTAATGRLFRRGILLTGGTALERLAEVDTVLFDKTGTLTEGRPELIGAEALPEPVLALAAALAAGSAHPLARAIAEAAERRGVAPVALQSRRELPGLGIEGEHGGARLRLGRAEWVAEIAGSAPQDADAEAQDEPAEGPEVWLVRAGGRPLRLRFRDRLRPGIARAVAALRRAGLELALISGDRPAAVEAVARQLGIEHWRAGVRPEDKLAEIERLKAEGRRVLMLGDGLNDAAALAAAHASAAPGSALDAARTAADAILTGAEGPARLPELIAIARAARRRVLENFALAALYNAVSIPLALAGMVTPLIAAIAMSSSSIVVTLNAIRLPKGLPWPRSSI